MSGPPNPVFEPEEVEEEDIVFSDMVYRIPKALPNPSMK
jgi:hypothetical protein